MRKFLSYIRIVLEAGFVILFYHFTKFIRYSKNPTKYPLEKRYKYARKVMSTVIKAYRAELHISGLENVTNLNEKVCFISNHLSEADPLVLMTILEKPISFAAKKETLEMPFVGKVLQSIEGIPLDRGNVMNQLQEIRKIVDMIKGEDKPNICIFAEGTRNKQPENHCLEFKGGSIKMGYMANVKIIPVSIYGTFRLFSIKHFLRKYPVYVNFGKPIAPEQYKPIPSVELADQLRNQINENVDKYRLLDKKEVCAQRLTKKRKLFEIKVDNVELPS